MQGSKKDMNIIIGFKALKSFEHTPIQPISCRKLYAPKLSLLQSLQDARKH